MELAEVTKKILWRYLKTAIFAAFLAFLVRSFLVEAYRVTTTTMSPTLQPGDSFLILKPEFGFTIPLFDIKVGKSRIPIRGEVIVFRSQFPPYFDVAQRVVGLPGEKISVQNGIVYLNGQPLGIEPNFMESESNCRKELESFGLQHRVCREQPLIEDHVEVTLRPDQVFVVGDHRIKGPNDGKKFRTWGVVPIGSVRGTAWRIWVSVNLDKAADRLRWERIWSPISRPSKEAKP